MATGCRDLRGHGQWQTGQLGQAPLFGAPPLTTELSALSPHGWGQQSQGCLETMREGPTLQGDTLCSWPGSPLS